MLLKNVDRETVVIALRGADAVMREVLLGNMSKRAAQDLRDELTMGSPVARSAVEKAQEEIVSIALRLRDEGVIALGTGGGASDMV
jgi:flagellar motor switch protein FliG